MAGGAGAGGGRRRAGVSSFPGEDRAPAAAAGDAHSGGARPAGQRANSGGHLPAAHRQGTRRPNQGERTDRERYTATG